VLFNHDLFFQVNLCRSLRITPSSVEGAVADIPRTISAETDDCEYSVAHLADTFAIPLIDFHPIALAFPSAVTSTLRPRPAFYSPKSLATLANPLATRSRLEPRAVISSRATARGT